MKNGYFKQYYNKTEMLPGINGLYVNDKREGTWTWVEPEGLNKNRTWIDSNIRLRAAINSARSANMPKDNIERAIKKGEGNDKDSTYEEVRYEGYGPSGVAVIVEAMTNNKNRTAAEIRSTFSKFGGNLGETGSVSYSFKRLGSITIEKKFCD